MSDETWIRETLMSIQAGQAEIRERLVRLDVLLGTHDKRSADHSQRLAAIEQQRDRALGFLAALAFGGGTIGALAGAAFRALGVMP